MINSVLRKILIWKNERFKNKNAGLRQQVNTQWNEIDKRKDFIRNFNQDMDFYINSVESYEARRVW